MRDSSGGTKVIHEHAPSPAGGETAALSDRVRSLRLAPNVVHQGRGATWLPWFLCVLFAGMTLFLGYAIFSDPATGTPPAAEVAKASGAASAGDDVASGRSGASEPGADGAGAADAASGSSGAAGSGAASSGRVVLDAKGYIIPVKQVLVSPKVSGMMIKSAIREGRFVRQGEELARLEDTDYRADLNRAKAALEGAKERLKELQSHRPEEVSQVKAELAESQAQLVQLEAAWKRASQLVKASAVSTGDWEEAESRFRTMQRRVERLKLAVKLMEDGPRLEKRLAAEADVRQAEAELRKAEWRLENTVIRAPISGTILKKNAEEGNIVNPIAMNGSFSLCDLADLSDLEVEVAVMESDIPRVFKNQECRIRATPYPDRTYRGYVSRLMPVADRAKGAVWVRVKVIVPAEEEEGTFLKPEMGALVTFLGGKK